jgi:hypothetical protein
MKSSFFGTRGTIAASKSNHPVLQCLVNAFPESIKSLFQDKNSLSMSVMDIAITNFITNLTSMWTDKNIIKTFKQVNYSIAEDPLSSNS